MKSFFRKLHRDFLVREKTYERLDEETQVALKKKDIVEVLELIESNLEIHILTNANLSTEAFEASNRLRKKIRSYCSSLLNRELRGTEWDEITDFLDILVGKVL